MKTFAKPYLTGYGLIDTIILDMLTLTDSTEKYQRLYKMAKLVYRNNQLEKAYIDVLHHYANNVDLDYLIDNKFSIATKICVKQKAFVDRLRRLYLPSEDWQSVTSYEYLLHRYGIIDCSSKWSKSTKVHHKEFHDIKGETYQLLYHKNETITVKYKDDSNWKTICTLRRLYSGGSNHENYTLELVNPNYIDQILTFMCSSITFSYTSDTKKCWIIVDKVNQPFDHVLMIKSANKTGNVKTVNVEPKDAIREYISNFPDYIIST